MKAYNNNHAAAAAVLNSQDDSDIVYIDADSISMGHGCHPDTLERKDSTGMDVPDSSTRAVACLKTPPPTPREDSSVGSVGSVGGPERGSLGGGSNVKLLGSNRRFWFATNPKDLRGTSWFRKHARYYAILQVQLVFLWQLLGMLLVEAALATGINHEVYLYYKGFSLLCAAGFSITLAFFMCLSRKFSEVAFYTKASQFVRNFKLCSVAQVVVTIGLIYSVLVYGSENRSAISKTEGLTMTRQLGVLQSLEWLPPIHRILNQVHWSGSYIYSVASYLTMGVGYLYLIFSSTTKLKLRLLTIANIMCIGVGANLLCAGGYILFSLPRVSKEANDMSAVLYQVDVSHLVVSNALILSMLVVSIICLRNVSQERIDVLEEEDRSFWLSISWYLVVSGLVFLLVSALGAYFLRSPTAIWTAANGLEEGARELLLKIRWKLIKSLQPTAKPKMTPITDVSANGALAAINSE